MNRSFAHILEPITIRDLRLKNRMIAAPMGSLLASPEGYVTQELMETYRQRAWGGFGLVVVEACAIRQDGLVGGFMLKILDHTYVPGMALLAETIHAGGAKASLQLLHGGGATDGKWSRCESLTPSGISHRWTARKPNTMPVREISGGEIDELVECYAQAARRARDARFDTVLIHMAHGTLPNQFMTPYLNRRTDKWGEPSAFGVALIKRIREVVGDRYPIGVRISADMFMGEEGASLDRMLKIAAALEVAGADIMDVSAGQVASGIYDGWMIQPVYKPRGVIVHLAEAIKKVVKVPVVAVGRLNDPSICEKIVATGQADLVAFGRVAYADPDFARKVEEGRAEEIRKCTACDLCSQVLVVGLPARCAINYEFGRLPWEYEIRPALHRKKVVIVGGGVAGMQCARDASLRTHDVTLYEQADHLGGAMVSVASAVPRLNTRDLRNGALWQIKELRRLGVKVKLSRKVTAELVAEVKPDVVVLATGSRPLIPDIPGTGLKKVITVDHYLRNSGTVNVGEKVVVVGGGYGAEVALSLDRDGKQVALIESGRRIGETPYLFPRILVLRKYLSESKVSILTETKVKEITEPGVVLIGKDGKEQLVEADTVILALGRVSENQLADELRGRVPQLFEIGDGRSIGNMLDAIHSGAAVARRI